MNPDKCGEHLFSVLNDFDATNKDEFASQFISLTIINELGADKRKIKNKKRRDRFLNMTDSIREKLIINPAYEIIEGEGSAFSINWKRIKYLGFVYEDQIYSSLISVRGKLVFEYNKKKYDVGAVYVKTDYGWKLAAILGLYLQGVNNPQKAKPLNSVFA